jgi:hypothetical protein
MIPCEDFIEADAVILKVGEVLHQGFSLRQLLA